MQKLFHQVLIFDKQCAEVWGRLMAVNPHNVADKQIIATALVHDFTLITRNVKDTIGTNVKVINPFETTAIEKYNN